MANRKEIADQFYKEVMGGSNVFAKGILGKITEACSNLTGTDPVQVMLTKQEAEWLFSAYHGNTLSGYVSALTNGKRVAVEWYRVTESVIHIEDTKNLCDECRNLPGMLDRK